MRPARDPLSLLLHLDDYVAGNLTPPEVLNLVSGLVIRGGIALLEGNLTGHRLCWQAAQSILQSEGLTERFAEETLRIAEETGIA